MLQGKTIGVVIPAYNEEGLIGRVVVTLPDFVDQIVVVDDVSTDRTVAEIEPLARDPRFASRLTLLRRARNEGVGAALADGYRWARDKGIDVTAVMNGDGQMNPAELERIVLPVVENRADYAKGNRLLTEDSWRRIPRSRFLGNAVLSFFTKIVSGYWSVMDSQTGFTAISLRALRTLSLDNLYKKYGVPNDILVKLNIYNFRLAQVPVEPVYHVGERSKMRLSIVAFTIPCLLTRLFFYRLFYKYVVRDFHPIFLYYMGGISFTLIGLMGGLVTLILDILLSLHVDNIVVPYGWMLFYTTFFLSGINMLFFGMWLDRDENKELQVNVLPDSHRL